MSFFTELKRRNVVRVGIAYALVAWVVLQAVDFLVQVIGAPAWVLQIFVIAAAIGLLAVLIFAWVFEMTPEGIKRESEVDRTRSITPSTGRKLDRMIIVFLAVAVVFLLAQRYWDPSASSEAPATAAQPAEGDAASPPSSATPGQKSVAVLPFTAFSSGPDDEYFADGLTEEILNALAQLPELLVTARTSAFAFKGQDKPIQEIAAALGVDHVVEGSVRRSGDRLRVTAQLVRAADGFHLWSETYDSTSEDAIAVQEDIAVQIARVLDVILDEDRREAMRRAGLRDVEAFIAFQKGLEAYGAAHGSRDQFDELMKANEYFDRVLQRVPDYPPALTHHADAWVHEYTSIAMSGEEREGDQEAARVAYQNAVADFTAATANARSFDERAANEFDLAAITGQFGGIVDRLQAVMALEGCMSPIWWDQVALLFGFAHQIRSDLERLVACDPLSPTERFSSVRAALWDGDAQAALEQLEQARADGLNHPWLDTMQVQANIALGQFETAANLAKLNNQGNFISAYRSGVLAAARGDRESAVHLYEQLRAQNLGADYGALQHFAQIGDREAANRVAARIDARALSPMPLITISTWCACGAPFDLEATPNFAAKLAEGNLSWPPPKVIDFPLKGW